MKKSAFVLATVGLAFLTACSDPCGDIKDCCLAMVDAIDWEAMDPGGTLGLKAQMQATCDGYDDADDDACQAAIDAYEPTPGVAVPDECDF